MANRIDNILISTLKTLACCVILASVMSATAQLVDPSLGGGISTMSSLS